MRLVSFASSAPHSRRDWRAGLLLPGGTHVLDLTACAEGRGGLPPGLRVPDDHLAWFDLDGSRCALARSAWERGVQAWPDGSVRALEEVCLLAPVPRPGKIVAVGLNYRDHAAEARLAVPASPVIFAKFPTAVVGPGEAIELPASSGRVDYEAELAVVIGRRVRGVGRAGAERAVFGYTAANDVSERDFQKADGQWVRAKSCDTFAPLGPAIVTLDDLPDPHALGIELRLNGAVMQRSNTRELVFDVPALVAFVAETITLEPGDVLLTGTPPGVGFARRPPVYLRPGDLVEVEIEGVGVLRNPVVGARGDRRPG